MHDQYLDKLAADIMSLIEGEKPSEQNIGTRGTALINDFIHKPGVQESLAQLDVRRRSGCGATKALHADSARRRHPKGIAA